MRTRHAVALALLLAAPCRSALADANLGSLTLEPPATPNGGPERWGLVRLDFIVVNRSSQPVRLRAIDVRLLVRPMGETEFVEIDSRPARGLLIPPESPAVSEPPPTREIVVPPGRHRVSAFCPRMATNAYALQRASVRLRAIEGGVARERSLDLEFVSTRRHPRRR